MDTRRLQYQIKRLEEKILSLEAKVKDNKNNHSCKQEEYTKWSDSEV